MLLPRLPFPLRRRYQECLKIFVSKPASSRFCRSFFPARQLCHNDTYFIQDNHRQCHQDLGQYVRRCQKCRKDKDTQYNIFPHCRELVRRNDSYPAKHIRYNRHFKYHTKGQHKSKHKPYVLTDGQHGSRNTGAGINKERDGLSGTAVRNNP